VITSLFAAPLDVRVLVEEKKVARRIYREKLKERCRMNL